MPTPPSTISHRASRKRGRETPTQPTRASFREKGNAPPERLRYVPDAEEALEIEALRAGNPEALNRLVCQHSRILYGAIFRRVRDPDQAQSLLQETFLQAIRSIHTFRARSKLSTWLYSIAMNVTRDALRREQRYKGLSENELDRLPLFTTPGTHAEWQASRDPEAVVEQRERSRIVRDAIDRLSESYRTIIMMRYLKELSTAEVATMLGITEGAVRVRLHRACNALREQLSSRWPELSTPVQAC